MARDAVVDVVAGGVRLATLRLAGAGLPAVDALARLRLAAGRRGWTLVLREAPPDLRALLGLCGLDAVVSAGEPGRQPERREQRRLEEVVQPDEPPA